MARRNELQRMSDRELLLEIAESSRRAEIVRIVWSVVAWLVLVAFVVLLVVYVPRINTALRQLDATLQNINTLVNSAQGSLNRVDMDVIEDLQARIASILDAIDKIASFLHIG